MSWRDRFLPASFRGVRFSIEEADTTGGRRAITHEYPDRNLPFVEDLGRRAREFQVEGFIVGEDYDRQRDALIEACEADGPGTLVHPYRGTQRVVCTGITTRERISEQRVVRVSMQFIEAGQARFPRVGEDRLSRLDSAARATTNASESVLEDGFSLTGMPEFVRQDTLGTLRDAANGVRDLLDNVGQASSEAVSAIDFVADSAGTLVDAPGDMATAITSMVNDVTGAMDRAVDALDIAEGMRSFYDEADPVPETTATRQQQSDNRAALVRHVKIASIAAGARAAARVSWPSRQRAVTRRDRLLDWIEETQLETNDTALYDALQEIRARLSRTVPAPDERLPSIETLTLSATIPSLVLAHRLYGPDELVERADDLVARNDVRHPGYIPGGVPLEYVTRVE